MYRYGFYCVSCPLMVESEIIIMLAKRGEVEKSMEISEMCCS